MGVSKEQLASIIGGRARELCSPSNTAYVDTLAKGVRENYNPDPDSFDDSLSEKYCNELGFGSSVSTMESATNNARYESAVKKSRMPDAIKQSMLSERIDKSALANTSVLDSLNVKAPARQQIVEQPQYRAAQPSAPSSNVDYTIIKAIVKECVNECLADYFAKQPLNEGSSLKTIGLQKGNIKLIDNSGNVFQAKLEKVGNLNESKN